MYRHLIRLERQQGYLGCYNKLASLAAIRPFSTGGNNDSDDKPSGAADGAARSSQEKKGEDDKKKGAKKPRSYAKSVVVKLQSNAEAVPKKEHLAQKIETLVKSAKSIESIAPNDKKSVSQSIGKPKTFIRRSARGEVDMKAVTEQSVPIENVTRGLDKRLVDAARRVASKMPKHIAKAAEKELIDSIEKQKSETQQAKKKFESTRGVKEDFTKSISYQIMRESRKSTINEATLAELNERIASTVEKIQLPPRSQKSFSHQRRFPMEHKSGFKKDTSLFSGECLNIFDPKGLFPNSDISRNIFWEKLHRQEIELSVDFPPENPFEEMIKWTKEGKLWQYPINNEQGLEAEEEVPFYEHVLLDNLLEGFPDRGPVRQFMELIIMGLSHNPYITVERKHETINFYRKFFEEKDLLSNLAITEETTGSGGDEATTA